MKSDHGQSNKWRPGASRLAVEARAVLLADIRSFFACRKIIEVETPVLSRAGNSDPNIHNISTDSLKKKYLRTSPEYPMKRLLASGHRDIFEMGRVFRAGENGRFHNPEFTLLEWYRLGWNYLDLAGEVIELIRTCGRGQFDGWPVNRLTYRELFRRETGLDPLNCDETELESCALERGLQAGPMDHQEWLDLVLSQVIQPALPGETFTVLYEFPPAQAALARIRGGDTPVAERFEIYLGQMELANGYQELSDADEQFQRFQREKVMAANRGEDTPPIDENLLSALRHGLPDCAGVALGVDRLLMSCLKLERIDSVLAFGADRA
jgi:lysyl-tRNA synthetase class 2